jgi:hypothetical protein
MEQSTGLLQKFVRELLVAEGALVEEIETDELEVISPPHLQQTLKIPELGCLGFATELPKGVERVGLESDWLERFGRVLGERGRFSRRILRTAMPTPSNPERTVEHTLILQNAVYRLINVEPAWTRYFIMAFRYTALSDEKRDGILQVGLNLSNGSTIDGLVRPLLIAAEKAIACESPPVEIKLPSVWSAEQLNRFIKRALPDRLQHTLSPFLAGMQRRLERDMARVHDYHNGLREESLTRMRKQPAEAEREQLRQEAIAREYQAKVADLQQKYDMKIEVAWIHTMELIMPVQRFNLLIKRRKGERYFHLDWSPLERKLEPAPCEYSYTFESGRMVCDEALHLVSQAAHGPCTGCGRAYCRACHSLKCPKCGKAV